MQLSRWADFDLSGVSEGLRNDMENEVMKIFIATVVLATTIASPIMAQQMNRPAQDRSTSWSRLAPEQAFAAEIQPNARMHSPNPAFDVYDNSGTYAGSDPDSRIRAELRRDNPLNPQRGD